MGIPTPSPSLLAPRPPSGDFLEKPFPASPQTHRFLSRLALTHTLSKGTRQPGTPEPHHTVVFLFSDQRIRDKAPQPRGQASLEALVRLPQR